MGNFSKTGFEVIKIYYFLSVLFVFQIISIFKILYFLELFFTDYLEGYLKILHLSILPPGNSSLLGKLIYQYSTSRCHLVYLTFH